MYFAFSKYLIDWVTSKEGCGSLPIISSTTILKKYFPEPDFSDMAFKVFAKAENRILMETDPSYKYYGCTCVQDILDLWSRGATDGTKMHNVFEDFANLVEHDRHNGEESKLFEQLYYDAQFEGYNEKAYFLEFCQKFGITEGKRRFWRTEILFWHDVLHCSGMADGVVYDTETDSYILIDWKRVKGGLKKDPKNPRKPTRELKLGSRAGGLPAFEEFRNTNLHKYSTQLTIYKHLFERTFPDKKISGLYLVVVDSLKLGKPDALEIFEVPLTKYDEAVGQAFVARAREILDAHGDALPSELAYELINFLPPASPEPALSPWSDESMEE